MLYFFSTLLLIISLFAHLDRYFFKKNDSFCPKYILPNWSRIPHYETKLKAIDAIVSQPFFYLTKGNQNFVFVSQDQKWVIKFFRLPRTKRALSFSFPSSNPFFEKCFQNTKAVYEELHEETGIIYSHLKQNQNSGTIHLIDRFQEHYFLPLGNLPFCIQKYGEDYFSYLNSLEDPKPLIAQTIQLFSQLYEKEFIDRDPILDKNFGVIAGKPFIMDTGQLEKCEILPPKREYLMQMTQSLGGKLQREYPSLYPFYKNLLQ